MDSNSEGSVTSWIHALRNESDIAAQELWNRYFARIVAIASARLGHLARDRTGEDVALSAMKSVMLGIRGDHFPDLTDRNGLWPLLLTITARKVIDEQRRQLAGNKTPDREEYASKLEAYIGSSPTPEFIREVADELEVRLASLGDSTLITIVQLKLQGYTNEEIARSLGCTTRTVIRKLNRIRDEWSNSRNA
ncbi:ECF-type sigma factor [Lacipirellula limnantheis]|uniref:RNA polymerase sigma factor n=1 Tax=Lacipirellula limnantheis TaxID=2528024 RepID=A0A517TRI6_9BACT|nr:ECF-type sigma factor [Lacipirellula limnantheis]QDT70992.1 RNA polymerase sigma factor [Lacipirellula limnantheis]